MWTHRFAIFTACATFVLLLIGGIVHGTGSSLACPDWPLCFGQFFPEMKGNVFFEHGHRLFASLVGVLTVILCGLCFGVVEKGQRWGRRLGLLAVGLVIFQGVLGGLTVIYKLPTLISLAHLCTSMLFFALVLSIACLSRRSMERIAVSRPAYRMLAATAVLCYLQITLGGLVRHTGAGLACLDIPLCKGGLLPLGEHPTVVIQALHRLTALLLTLALVFATMMLPRLTGFARLIKLALPLLITVQIGLGLESVRSFLGLVQVTTHLGVGALLWALLVVELWLLRPLAQSSEVSANIPTALVSQPGGVA